jgi:L-histidine Nalpha-methyltransferase
MHLVALQKHAVGLGRHRFRFAAGETIHTENSYKYSPEEFGSLAARAGFGAMKTWTDRRGLFAVFGLI